ncbi:nucleolar transcription factor 1-like [Physella acuta]|uniref:nucleolar transcription factor 1-like n=1 Tax=Physella acuta TaxID=109671 RepID=UPI0027DE05D5|nr:nucleolar transcription factor 1-like [Physella acuta]
MDWSFEEQVSLLEQIEALAAESTKPFNSFMSAFEWKDVNITGKDADQCKEMFTKLTHKTRKYRTAAEVTRDSIETLKQDGFKIDSKNYPDLPKKPPSSYSLFIKEQSDGFQGNSFQERNAKLSKLWKELPEEDKKYYKIKSQKLREKYNETLEIFKQNHPGIKIPGSTTSRPQCHPVKLFIESRIGKVQAKNPDLSHADCVKKCTKKYEDLSDRKKLKWIQKAKNAFQQEYQGKKPSSTSNNFANFLTKEEKRIWESHFGKPIPPAKNVFQYFTNNERASLSHLPIAEQSRELSARYNDLSKEKHLELHNRLVEEVKQYSDSYKQYYAKLPEDEKKPEELPSVVLRPYNKILNSSKPTARKRKKDKQQIGIEDNDLKVNERASTSTEDFKTPSKKHKKDKKKKSASRDDSIANDGKSSSTEDDSFLTQLSPKSLEKKKTEIEDHIGSSRKRNLKGDFDESYSSSTKKRKSGQSTNKSASFETSPHSSGSVESEAPQIQHSPVDEKVNDALFSFFSPVRTPITKPKKKKH